jgi:hypothetical protein
MRTTKIITLILGLFLLFTITSSAQNSDLLPHEKLEKENQPGYYEENYIKALSNAAWREKSRKGQIYQNADWKNQDSATSVYYRDLKILEGRSWTWDSVSTVWKNSSLAPREYDALHRLTRRTIQNWAGINWANLSRVNLTYNGTFTKPSEEIIQSWSGIWDNFYKWSYAYNSSGFEISRTDQRWLGGTWVNDKKTDRVYDSNNNVIEYIQQDWDGSAWVYDYRYIYNYNSSEQLTDYLLQYWVSGAWQNTTREFSYYNSSGLNNERITEQYVSGNWQKYGRTLLDYTAQNLLSLYEYQNWDNNNSIWVPTHRTSYIYDAQQNLTTSTFHQMGMNWYDVRRNIYAYDANNNRLSNTYQENLMGWQNINRYLFEYEQYTPTAIESFSNLNSVELFPNPTLDNCTLMITGDKESVLNLELYNLQGQQLKQWQHRINTEKDLIKIDIQNYPAGIYFIVLRNQGAVKTLKLQKQ